MASILKVDTIQDQSGNNIINENADTITIGASGDTITIPSGATLTNDGTQTGLTLSDNILFNTASKGIYLGVTSATASNLLDDYEEGTWTPIYTVQAGTDYPSITYDAFTGGKYTKIGRLVSIQATLRTDAVDSTGVTGAIHIGGLPFASAGNTGSTRDGVSAVSLTDQADWLSGNTPNTGTVASGNTIITIGQLYSSSSNTSTILGTNLQTGANKNRINIQAVYMTA
jgi:hypothetical protein